MKLTLKYTFIGLSLLFGAANTGHAQDVMSQYKEDNGVATSKKVSAQNSDGSYTITLETFATGTSTSVQETIPADIVLVLDLTTSMRVNRGTPSQVTTQKSLSYNDVVNNARTKGTNYLYYDSTDRVYCQIFAEEYGGRYYLYFNRSGNNRRNYLYRNGNNNNNYTIAYRDNTRDNSNTAGRGWATSPDDPIVTFRANTNLYTGASRIFDLKEATCAFIDVIAQKDITDNGRLGNKFSIISFAGTPPVVEQELADISTMDLDALKAKVWAFELHNGTYPAPAITSANTQLSTNGHSGTVGTDFTRTVVLFTDGDPYDTPKYQAINPAHESKSTLKATVFTVGMFDSTPSGNYNNPTGSSNLWQFMNYVSSNYPDATVTGNTGNGTMSPGNDGGDKGFFKDVSGDDVDLSSVFSAIAHASGGSEKTLDTSTQVRDVVSSSFAIAFPSTVTTPQQKQAWVNQNVSVSTATISQDGRTWGTSSAYTDATITYVVETDEEGVEYDAIRVEGFDYSKPDTKDANGYTTPQNAGNWVGIRYRSANSTFYAGKKLVIQFNVFLHDGVTGGITGTNTRASGVYVYDEETGQYKPVTTYDVPSKVLSVTIKISKDGLRSGESATFLINKTTPKKDANGNIVYNAIGKPEPDPNNWETEHKVILTNKSDINGETVIKTLYGLDPNYVYEVVEDDWGWAYTLTGSGEQMTTSSVTINPFEFTNTEKTEIDGKPIRKHAEAVTINHFGYTIQGGEFDGKQEEHYKSSKVEHF